LYEQHEYLGRLHAMRRLQYPDARIARYFGLPVSRITEDAKRIERSLAMFEYPDVKAHELLQYTRYLRFSIKDPLETEFAG